MNKGDIPMIGVRTLIEMHIGWTEGDGSGSEGYNVSDYFDRQERYLGPDEHGIEPVFRDMSEGEADNYLRA